MHHSKHLLETFFAACLVPTITRPTRITSESATLIDNIYVSGNRLEYLRSVVGIMNRRRATMTSGPSQP